MATRVHVRPGAGGATATDVTMLAVSPAGVYWVTQPQDGLATLQHARRLGGRAQQVATAPDIRSLAVVGREVLYLTEDKQPNSGQLWRATGAGAAQSLATGLRAPQGVLPTGGQLTWTETRPSPAPGVACVPVLQPLSLLMRADNGGQGRALLAVSESAEAHFTGKLLGERDGQLYWLQHFGQQYNRPLTVISRVPLQGGPVEQLVRVEGKQDAVLARRVLYWTAPSEELAPALAGRSVRCLALAGGEPRTLTDWMGPDGVLLLVGQRPYYCDRTYLWRIPRRLGEARPVSEPKLDPECLTNYGGAIYARTTRGDSSRLVRVPVTWGARLRGLLGP